MTSRVLCLALLAVLSTPAALYAQNQEQIREYEQRIEAQQRALDELRRELEALEADTPDATTATEAADQGQAAAVDDASGPGAERAIPGPFLLRASDTLNVRFSGRVHRMLMNVHDGIGTTNLFTDSEQGPTMLRFDAEGTARDNLTIGASIEVGLRENRPLLVSQDNSDGGTSINVRIAEVTAEAAALGKFSLGRGFSAGWLTPEIDLSGTQFASLLSVGMLAPGLKFANAATAQLTDIQVLEHFADLERLLLVDRMRFDSAVFGPGFQVSSSIAADSRWDAVLRAKPAAGERWTLVSGASFQKRPFSGIAQRVDAAISVRHNDTGINLTAAFSRDELAVGDRDSDTYLVKLGWLADLVDIGQTAFSLDYYDSRDLRLAGDRSRSTAFFVVQKWPAFGLDVYGGLRRYDVDRPNVDLEPLDVIVFGAAFNF